MLLSRHLAKVQLHEILSQLHRSMKGLTGLRDEIAARVFARGVMDQQQACHLSSGGNRSGLFRGRVADRRSGRFVNEYVGTGRKTHDLLARFRIARVGHDTSRVVKLDSQADCGQQMFHRGAEYPEVGAFKYRRQLCAGHAMKLEDNLYIKKGVLAKTNAEMVKKVIEIAHLLDREVATPKEARQILKLKS